MHQAPWVGKSQEKLGKKEVYRVVTTGTLILKEIMNAMVEVRLSEYEEGRVVIDRGLNNHRPAKALVTNRASYHSRQSRLYIDGRYQLLSEFVRIQEGGTYR